MFCKNCGTKIEGSEDLCPSCKALINLKIQQKKNNYALAGFILSFILTIPGFICSVLGIFECKNKDAPYSEFAVAGIIISIVNSIIFCIALNFLLNPLLDLIF